MKTDASQTLRSALAVFAAALLLVSCGGDSGSTPAALAPAPAPAPAPTPPPPTPEPEAPEMVTYIVEAQATESYSNNPQFQLFGFKPFPEGAGGVDAIALLAHPADMAPWEVGGIASAGLKTLAETGESAALIDEGGAMGFTTVASSFNDIAGLVLAALLNPATSEGITVSLDQPCLSYAQRLDPSSDWFIGFASVCTVDEAGNWLDELALTASMYDAGTAEGEPYAGATGPTAPQQPISKVELPPWDENAVTTITARRKME